MPTERAAPAAENALIGKGRGHLLANAGREVAGEPPDPGQHLADTEQAHHRQYVAEPADGQPPVEGVQAVWGAGRAHQHQARDQGPVVGGQQHGHTSGPTVGHHRGRCRVPLHQERRHQLGVGGQAPRLAAGPPVADAVRGQHPEVRCQEVGDRVPGRPRARLAVQEDDRIPGAPVSRGQHGGRPILRWPMLRCGRAGGPPGTSTPGPSRCRPRPTRRTSGPVWPR